MIMNPQTTYNNYLNQYGEVEGKEKFMDLCEEMEEREPFPKCLVWIEIARKILKGEL